MYNTPPNVCLKFEALYICLIWKHNAFDQRTYDKEKEIFLGKIKIRFFWGYLSLFFEKGEIIFL